MICEAVQKLSHLSDLQCRRNVSQYVNVDMSLGIFV